MYVCLCKGVTDRQIRERAREAPVRLRDLRQEFGLGSECGRCCSYAQELIRSTSPGGRAQAACASACASLRDAAEAVVAAAVPVQLAA